MQIKEPLGDSDLDRFLEVNPNLAKRMVDREPLVELAVILLKLRAGLGLTQEQLAEKADLTPSQVSEYENAANPGITLKTLARIAKAVGSCLRICYDSSDPTLAGKVLCSCSWQKAEYLAPTFRKDRLQRRYALAA